MLRPLSAIMAVGERMAPKVEGLRRRRPRRLSRARLSAADRVRALHPFTRSFPVVHVG